MLFVLLQMEQTALLVGAVAPFVVLAAGYQTGGWTGMRIPPTSAR
jgi:hypothetical protein